MPLSGVAAREDPGAGENSARAQTAANAAATPHPAAASRQPGEMFPQTAAMTIAAAPAT